MQEWSEDLKPTHPRIIALNDDITRREKLLEIFIAKDLFDGFMTRKEKNEKENGGWNVTS